MRLIDADKLDWWYKGRPIRRVIDEAPTIDAVHVVRCKDCKSYRLFKNRFGVEISRCMLIGADVGSDDYCSYGERKDGDS